MMKQVRATIVSLALFTIITGFIYPVGITVIAQVLFPRQANGSVVMKNGQPVGSELIGQYFTDPKYFWGRLSATGPVPYTSFNGDKLTGSSGSNYGPLNPALISDGTQKDAQGNPVPAGTVKQAVDAYHAADPDNTAPIPVDLVTASASGLDPDISPAGATYQVHRVARARGLDDATVQGLVDKYITGRFLGFLGEPYVNVLELNLALDALPGQSSATSVIPIAATQEVTP